MVWKAAMEGRGVIATKTESVKRRRETIIEEKGNGNGNRNGNREGGREFGRRDRERREEKRRDKIR
jgi:hypothetical protein